jgi:signal transduction histidine kinase
MLFGGGSGITLFAPDKITDNPYLPPIKMTDFKLLYKSVGLGGDSPLHQAIWETDHLTLSYEEDIITLEFAALSYANPAENLLQYKMEGFDDVWSPVGTNHSATYTNLDPGDYVFRVRGSNSDGVWNQEGTSLGITITPPWWGTTWFRALVLLLMVGLVVGGFRWRVRSIQARSQELEEEVASKTRDLREVIIKHEATEEKLRRTSDELSTILAVSGNITSTLELGLLLNLILDELKNVVDYDVGTIRRMVQGNMELLAHRWLFSQAGQPSQRLSVANIPIVREMVQTREAILVDDHQFNPEIVGDKKLYSGNLTGEVLQASRTLMCVPLVVKDETIGMLVLGHHQPNYWDEEKKELVQAFANQAAVAIVNAELYEQAGEVATLEERTRLARELHDSATQALYSATLFSEAGKELAESGDLESVTHYLSRVSEVVHQALKDMRLLVYQLRPPVLEKEGLVGALQKRLDAVEKRAGMEARLFSDQLPPLPDDVSEGLYRIAQEALNNALKHADADVITVNIRYDGASVTLEIVDDGCGFDPQTAESIGGMGLMNMKARTAQLCGHLEIDSTLDNGSNVIVTIPIVGKS